MSREIKFRALLEAIEGGERHWEYYETLFEPFWLDPNSVYKIVVENLQFTGLKDKNGKEIWEGDVVRWDERHGLMKQAVVEWRDQGFIPYLCLDTEVLGNIYENPELI